MTYWTGLDFIRACCKVDASVRCSSISSVVVHRGGSDTLVVSNPGGSIPEKGGWTGVDGWEIGPH